MKNKLQQTLEIAFKMASLKRYSQTHLAKDESVLEHTGFVALVAYQLGQELIQEGFHIDMGVMLRKAITHDIDEIITGDIPRPTKYYNEGVTDALRKIEDENMRKIADRIGNERMYEDWRTAKDGREGSVVAMCDCLAVVYKAWYEVVMLGNITIYAHVAHIPKSLERINVQAEKYFPDSTVLESTVYETKILCKQLLQKGESIK